MIQRAGVKPHARWRQAPRGFDRDGEEMLAKSFAGELVEQTEVRDLEPIVFVSMELEVPGECTSDGHEPDRQRHPVTRQS